MTEVNVGDEIIVKFTVTNLQGQGARVGADLAMAESTIVDGQFYIPWVVSEIKKGAVTHRPAPKPLPTGIGTLIEGDTTDGTKQITFIRANIEGRYHWYSPHTSCHYMDREITNWRLK